MTQQKVSFVIDADHMPAQQAFSLVSNSLRGVGVTAVRVSNDAAEGASKVASSWGMADGVLGRMKNTLLNLTAGSAAFYAAASAGAASWQRQIDVNMKALERTRDFLPAYQQIGYNAPDLAYMKTPEAKALTSAGVRARGSESPKDYLENVATSLGTRGAMTATQAHQTANLVGAIAGTQGFPQDDTNETIKAINFMAGKEISQGKKPDMEELIGTFVSMFGPSPTTEVAQLSTYGSRFIIPAVDSHGYSDWPHAAAHQAATQLTFPESKGRISAGINLDMEEELEKAYTDVYQYTKYAETIQPHQFAKMGEKKWDLVRDDPELRHWIQARTLGDKAVEQESRDLAHFWQGGSPTPFQGSLAGEHGEKEIFADLISKDSKGAKLEKQLLAEMKKGDEARAFARALAKGDATDPIGRAAIQDRTNKGLQASLDLNNITRTARAFPIELQQKAAERLGIGWWDNLAGGFDVASKTMGATEEEAAALNAEVANKYKKRILGSPAAAGSERTKKFHAYLRSVGADPAKYLGNWGPKEDKSLTKEFESHYEQFRVKEDMSAEDRGLYEDLDAYEKAQRSFMGNSFSPKPFPAFKDWYKPSGTGTKLESAKAQARAEYQAKKSEYYSSQAGPSGAKDPSHGAQESWEAGDFASYGDWRRSRPDMQTLFGGPTDRVARQQYEEEKAYYEDFNATAPKLRDFRPYEEWLKIQPEDPVGAQSLFGPTRLDTESRRQKYKEDKADYEDINATAPTRPDQSMNRMLERLERLAAAIETAQARALRGSVDVSVQDAGGRPLSRATSRPRALELLQDLA